MDVSDLKFTVPVIRVKELVKSECWGCAFNHEHDDEDAACDYMQKTHGECRELECVYIVDAPKFIAEHAKKLITGG